MTGAFVANRAAATLDAARRVLVTGCGDATPETTARACDVAEAIGAAVDFGHRETSQTAGPTIARIGEVTADPEELRDRADLVVFWFCDPASAARGFIERFVTAETAAGRPRRTIAVGPAPVRPASPAHRHLVVPVAGAVDLARLVQAAVAGRTIPAPPADLATAAATLHEALVAAGCVAIVTRHVDPVGIAPWSVVGLVRSLAHERPAFEVQLDPPGAAAVCAWRYGSAGAVARADRGGAEFRPAECDAVRLIERGDVDCVIAVGRLAEAVEAAIAARGTAVAAVRLAGDDAAVRSHLETLFAAVRALRGGAA